MGENCPIEKVPECLSFTFVRSQTTREFEVVIIDNKTLLLLNFLSFYLPTYKVSPKVRPTPLRSGRFMYSSRVRCSSSFTIGGRQ